MGMLMVATSPWAARLLAAPHLQVAIATSALAMLLILMNEAQQGVLSGLEAFKRRSRVQFATGIASFPISYSASLLWADRCRLGIDRFAESTGLLNYKAIQKETSLAAFPIRWREAGKEIATLATFSLPTLCSGALYVPSMWIREHDFSQQPRWICRNGDLQRS